MLHPPGRATAASPSRATRGPSTKNPARIFLTSSAAGSAELSAVESTANSPPPFSCTFAPRERRIAAIARASEMSGTPRTTTAPPEQQRAPASTARAEFLEPLMGTWPERWTPPEMTSLWWWWSVERGRTGTAGASAAKCEGIGWRETGEGMEWEKGSAIGQDRRGLGQVSTEEGEAKSREFGVMFIETSAKGGFNIKPLFRKIAASLPGMETLASTKQEDMVDVNLKSTVSSTQTQQQSGGCSC
ncbi:Signal recognition particle receptor beta subunit [Musa troglodytarum]|uniref:Signal recognition particle receptor beta subunit n=1 Tax=Musa troglodytarum TaxID=320322 RepID=A0A9E7FFH2_9LILI|nr:Signal recognition particle receptor beta subunit [Musa troglodytarum]